MATTVDLGVDAHVFPTCYFSAQSARCGIQKLPGYCGDSNDRCPLIAGNPSKSTFANNHARDIAP